MNGCSALIFHRCVTFIGLSRCFFSFLSFSSTRGTDKKRKKVSNLFGCLVSDNAFLFPLSVLSLSLAFVPHHDYGVHHARRDSIGSFFFFSCAVIKHPSRLTDILSSLPLPSFFVFLVEIMNREERREMGAFLNEILF